jgi:predicted ATP-dependent protease
MAPRRRKKSKHPILSPEEARWTCDPGMFEFANTESLTSPEPFLGQKRALRALQFGVEARNPGFNVFVVGENGTGRTSMAETYLREVAARAPAPDDYCYVQNFDNTYRPCVLRLPAGAGRALRDSMEEVIKELEQALPSAFEEEDYERDRAGLKMKIEQKQSAIFETLRQSAEEQGFAIARTQQGFAIAPIRDGQVMEPAQLSQLDEEEQEKLQAGEKTVRDLLRQTLRQFRDVEKAAQADLAKLEQDNAESVVSHTMVEIYGQFREIDEVRDYFDEVKKDILENLDEFKGGQGGDPEMMMAGPGKIDSAFPFAHRYKVNLLVDNSRQTGAPVVREDYPTYRNLLGRMDHEASFGTLVTHFSRIRPGSLHEANGGFLLLDAEEMLRNPQAWEGLKRVLRVKQLRLEEPYEQFKQQATVSMQPQPIPLDVKVVMIGTPSLYYMMQTHDSDFPELFKVPAEFRRSMNRSERSLEAFAGFCAARCKELDLLPLTPGAVAGLAEHSARSAGQQDRLDLRFRDLIDLIHESDFWTRKTGEEEGQSAPTAISAADVSAAIDHREDRGMHLQETVVRLLTEGTIRLDIKEKVVGQMNGLTVLQMGRRPFGAPARLSARVTAGQGFVVNVEREVQLSGPFHNKGVLILTGFLKGRYGLDKPLSINASVVFEQSYSPVDGDSASAAELCAIISAIAEVPIRQDIAMTGSVDQMGRVQAVGGLDEKIEGFYTACQALDPKHPVGVILPEANVRHLMLRPALTEAMAKGKLTIWPVTRVEAALEILTGVSAERIDELVEERLESLRESLRGPSPGGESMVIMPGKAELPSGPPDPGPKR